MKNPPASANVRIEILEARIAPATVAIIEVSALNGANGFKLQGEADGDFSGRSVSAAGGNVEGSAGAVSRTGTAATGSGRAFSRMRG